MSNLIKVPSFDFTNFYYPDLLRALLLFNRTNSPEITDENENEPFIQMLRAFALVGHLNNVNTDIVANETLLETAKLLESIRQMLKLIDVQLNQNIPATADVVLELAKAFTVLTTLAPINSKFATEETEDTPQITFSSIAAHTINPTDTMSHVFQEDATVFGSDKKTQASTDSVFWDMFDTSPAALDDKLYIGHLDILFDTITMSFNTFGSNFDGVWEFYDGSTDDENPDLVTNMGGFLRFELTELLGLSDKTNTSVVVTHTPSGVSETVNSTFSGGKNIIDTVGLLGQSTVSTDVDDYSVGTDWNPLSEVVDGTALFTQDGDISFQLPQTVKQNWIKTTINGISAYWLRFRVISHTGTMAEIDRIKITEGKQYLVVPSSQGSEVSDNPLGTSDGSTNQSFILSQTALIENSLIIKVDEGSGFVTWTLVDNFLNSLPTSLHYTLDITADDVATVTFGNGVLGKIPAIGTNNISADYKIGADANGNVGAQTINVNKAGISFVNRVFNPRAAKGWVQKEGATDEDIARLKIVGPASLRTRERALTTPDIQFLASEYVNSAGNKLVSRSIAIEETFGPKTIELVVVGIGGTQLTANEQTEIEELFNGNTATGIDPIIVANHEVTVVNYTQKIIDVTVTVTGGVKAEIENAITALLSPNAVFTGTSTFRWSFAEEVPTSVIIGEIFSIDPVNISKVVLTTPAADVALDTRELPKLGTLSVTVD